MKESVSSDWLFEALRLNTNPFDSFQVSLQQTVQRKRDDVVHVLQLQTGSLVRAQTSKCLNVKFL